jgi:hypothetical protein
MLPVPMKPSGPRRWAATDSALLGSATSLRVGEAGGGAEEGSEEEIVTLMDRQDIRFT